MDYPAINCRQCQSNLQTDNIEPDCDNCQVFGWDVNTKQILLILNQVVVNGELKMDWVKAAFNEHLIPFYKRPSYRRLLLKAHLKTQKHYAKQQRQSSS